MVENYNYVYFFSILQIVEKKATRLSFQHSSADGLLQFLVFEPPYHEAAYQDGLLRL
jgi:hypothetical protein